MDNRKLIPNENAGQRTKNRIREHGPEFEIIRQERVLCLDNQEALLVKSDDWLGWIPLNEVEK